MGTRLEARVYGLVQGVFFRHYTRITAGKFELTGSVANQPDGTVLVIAEGSQDNVDKLLEWLQQGPELARVDRVDVRWSSPLGNHTGFAILR